MNMSLDVVIVTYRSRPFIDRCLRSLASSSASMNLTVRVIDNASDDGTADFVRSQFPEVWLHVASRNLGFSAATNVGIRAGSSDYVLALNPDTMLTPAALNHLLALVEARPEIGICGCRLVREDGSLDHAAKRSFPTPISALGHFTGIGRRTGAPATLAAYRAPEVEAGPVDAVNGAFMLIRRRALDEVGLFDEGYWMYMEDLDLCYRFAQAGWTTWYEPSVEALHTKAASSGRYRNLRLNFAFHYGMFRFYRKHYASRRSPLVNVTVYAGIAAKLGVSAVRSAVNRHLLARA
jgi:N-acetylglucosaminyl-diphospho-decaprenol L-rhamnosyltransferase